MYVDQSVVVARVGMIQVVRFADGTIELLTPVGAVEKVPER